MDSEDTAGTAGISSVIYFRNVRKAGKDMKRCWIAAMACVLFVMMGTQAWAKDAGDSEQTANLLVLIGEQLSQKGSDVTQWISEELQKEDNAELAEKVIDFIRQKLEAGELETDEDISAAIEEGEDKFDVSLTEDEKDKILQGIQKIKKLGLDPEKLLDQAQKMCEDAGKELAEEASETIKQSFTESVTGFFQNMGSRVKGFFKGIF